MIAVVVDIAVANAGTVLVGSGNASSSGDIRERKLSGLAELVRVDAVGPARAIGDIDVEIPVAVEVEDGDAGGTPRFNWRREQIIRRVGIFSLQCIEDRLSGRPNA